MAKHNVWMSVSDLMTGLMVIFLFITISYMTIVQANQTVLVDYVETKNELHSKLVREFEGEVEKWQMSIGKDLSMKFNNPTVLFAQGSAELTPQFKSILNEFLPRYFGILLENEFKDKIREIRIEGHTDDVPYPFLDADAYIANVILSQRRSLNVLRHFRNMPEFQYYTVAEKNLLEYWFTANGLSYGKSLDYNGEYTQLSGNPIDRQLSRRVEFRIITSGDEVLEDFVIKNSKKNGK